MHDSALNELEKHFSGDASQLFYDHLAGCPECRGEVAAMEDVSLALRELRSGSGEAPEPRLGFYNRVAGDIIERQRNEAWGLFSPGAAFFRRIAFASLLVLASLGSFLVTRETSAGGTDAAAIMAEHGTITNAAANAADDQGRNADRENADRENADRDKILVTLASYR